ncbi:hypothetical protein RHM66_20530 [Pseudomonas sp. RTB3]|nr:hypothetical protein RHM66_20530 [Pseudomonas sp. RTB3]
MTQNTEYGESTRTLRLPAVRDNNLGVETIAIANDIITALKDATIRIAFEWQTADGTLLNRSGSTVVRVVGTAARPSPLKIDTSPVVLSGVSIVLGDTPRIVDFPGKTITRSPEGGSPPYVFSATGVQ